MIDVGDLYRHVTHEIRWGKQQQWQLTYYAVLLFGAIHLLYSLARRECIAAESILAFTASALASVLLLVGSFIVAGFQVFLVKNRTILRAIYLADDGGKSSYLSEGFQRVRGHRNLKDSFFANWSVWGSVILLLLAAALTVQIRAYAGRESCMLVWFILDLALVAVAVCVGYYRAEKERNRPRRIP